VSRNGTRVVDSLQHAEIAAVPTEHDPSVRQDAARAQERGGRVHDVPCVPAIRRDERHASSTLWEALTGGTADVASEVQRVQAAQERLVNRCCSTSISTSSREV
jgi:hypothetical protein